ncbi:MAG: fructose-bisphosphate aldolase [Pseudonocardia sp.]|uniref:class I fructose-bisphosphate aldolase n=1 Tax=Pseudonocardia sp. TaxID=60912 RepID=UPI001AD50601|nr:class I fructose-bisphosphate aldolase [Pseudonocardia sp.]MBN9102697.1 fructose-bisphosphate aldolase [Pseudonocardia sp.]
MDGVHHRLRRLFSFGRGILALDTGPAELAARFRAEALMPAARADYLAMLLGTPGLSEHVSGVVLTPDVLEEQPGPAGLMVGVRADSGHERLTDDDRHRVTSGLDGLAARLTRSRDLGVGFAVWSTVAGPAGDPRGMHVLTANGHAAARFALLCHDLGLVPVIRVGTRITGDDRGWRSATVAAALLSVCGHLHDLDIDVSGVVICIEVGSATEPLTVLPDDLGGVALIGETAGVEPQWPPWPPWPLTFYIGRQATRPALQAWRSSGSVEAGRDALLGCLATAACGPRAVSGARR